MLKYSMQNFEKEFSKLNSQQQKAVETIEGPVMVVAGPGTGKTQILALRIANILQKTDVNPENILCLTFTEAGVTAMRQRLSRFIGSAAYSVAIHTFHSFANEIIQTFPEKFAFNKELDQLDDLTQVKILHKIIDQIEQVNLNKDIESVPTNFLNQVQKSNFEWHLIPFFNKYSNYYDILNAIKNLKKENIDPENLQIKADALKKMHLEDQKINKKTGKPTQVWKNELKKLEKLEELSLIYQFYQEALKEEGKYDYEDMIMFVIEKFEEDSELLSHFQEKYLYIHVDEYQDTNGAQNRILELLGSYDDAPNIFTVGDDDQAIYRFQGANLDNILFFSKKYSQTKAIPITTNYRSTQVILDIADSLIQNNSTRLTNQIENLNKKLIAGNSSSLEQKAELYEFANNDEEDAFIAKKIIELQKNGIKLNEIAVIYRNNKHGEELSKSLSKFEISSNIDASQSIFEIETIQKFIELLRLINLEAKNQDLLFYNVLLSEYLEFDVVTIYKLSRYAYKTRKSFLEIILEDANFEKEINESEMFKLREFLTKILNWHKLDQNTTFPTFIERVLSESGIVDWASSVSSEDFTALLSLSKFHSYIKNLYSTDKSLNLSRFLEDLKVIEENSIKVSLPNLKNSDDSVNLVTAHSSKGLEFDYVFIYQANDRNWGVKRNRGQLLPTQITSEFSDEHKNEKELQLEDERRLFFVAITRAKKQVFFTYSKEYFSEGKSTLTSESQFIAEIDQKYLDRKSSENEESLKLLKEDVINKLKPVLKTNYSSSEKDYLLEQISKFKLSASSLNAYIKSPAEFKLNYLIKIPQAKSKSLAMGTAVHAALERLNKIYKEENLLISREDFLKSYESKLFKEFFGEEDYEATLVEGIKILEKYYDNSLASSIEIPCEVEYNFSYDNVFLELPNQEPIQLTGRIDKVVKLDGENLVKVVDYKTKTPESENQILGQTKNSTGDTWRQLLFYKLMGDLSPNFRPNKALKNSKYVISEAEVEYVKTDKDKFIKRNFKIAESDLSSLKELIAEVMQRIRNLEFPEESGLG